MIRIDGLFFHHEKDGGFQLKDISLDIPENRFSVILGPNGSGKTTLLKCIAGLLKIHQGSIQLEGRKLSGMTTRQRARRIAYVPQQHQPVFPYRVQDVVLMGRSPHLNLLGFPGKKDRLIAQKAMETIGVDPLADRIYSRLSGGERQLVLIARSLAQEASAMLMDEPVSHLDFKNQIIVLRQIRHLIAKHRVTVLMTVHDPNLAAAFADKLILMKNGRVFHQGGPEEIITAECLSELYEMEIAVSHGDRKWVYAP